MRILLIEDDPMIGRDLREALQDSGMSVDWTRNGEDGEAALSMGAYALVLLDIGLPGEGGIEVLRSVRKGGDKTPLVVITARDELDDRVAGLDLGADDYIAKPFEMRELMARIRAVLRRYGGAAISVLGNGEIELESAPVRRRLSRGLLKVWYRLTYEPPERRYERRLLRRMARGELTNTLGIQIRDETHTRATAEQWLAALVKLGLRPDDLCVEYGCGSLWCAEPIIRHLQPGRFIGLDATERFYEFGRQRLGSLLIEKQVGLAVISRRTLSEVAALKPALVYSHRVLHHVPRRALGRFVRSLASLLNERTILVIENTPRPSRNGSLKRRYNAGDIQPHLPQNWHCRQEAFGLLVTCRDRPPA